MTSTSNHQIDSPYQEIDRQDYSHKEARQILIAERNWNEGNNRLEMDIAIIKFVIIALGIDVTFFSYVWLFGK